MNKNFDSWNIQKKKIDMSNQDILFQEGEIWWCSVGLNIGEESCGKGEIFRRPVFILKKLSHANFIGIPVSTKIKKGTWFTSVNIHGSVQTFLLYQVRMFSVNRLQRRLVKLPELDALYIKEKLKVLLEFS